MAAHWRATLDRVGIDGPGEVADVARTLRTALGHILVNRSGPALQPGARAYARSWIRDGALTSSALLRLGHDDVARDFLLWFAPFQFRNGKVPCCATARGADPVPENDSDGEFAFAATELWRYSHDDADRRGCCGRMSSRPSRTWKRCARRERIDANRVGERRAYFGLMPPSISHEGYSDKAGLFVLGRLLGLCRLPERRRTRRGPRTRPTTRRASPRSATRSSPICGRRSRPAPPASVSTCCPARRTAATSIRRRARSPSARAACSTRCRAPLDRAHLRSLLAELRGPPQRRVARRSPRRRRLHPVRVAQRRCLRPARRARAGAAGAALFLRRPSAEGMEPVGRGGGARRARAALPRRHAARLGRIRPHPLRARPVRLRGRSANDRWCSRPACRWRGWRGKGLSIRDLRTPYGLLSWSARVVGADGAIEIRVSGLGSLSAGRRGAARAVAEGLSRHDRWPGHRCALATSSPCPACPRAFASSRVRSLYNCLSRQFKGGPGARRHSP